MNAFPHNFLENRQMTYSELHEMTREEFTTDMRNFAKNMLAMLLILLLTISVSANFELYGLLQKSIGNTQRAEEIIESYKDIFDKQEKLRELDKARIMAYAAFISGKRITTKK